MSERVVVVGGGVAGLAAALELADAGRQVTVLEARPRLGGATTSFSRGGLEVDTGVHVFLRCCTAYSWFLHRLGVERLTTMQPRLDVPVLFGFGEAAGRTRLRRPRLPLPAPAHLAPALLGYSALSAAQRLAAVPAALAIGRLDPADPAVDARAFGDWLAAHGQGPAAVSALWGLLTVATLNCEPDRASLALAAKVVRTGLLETAGGADIGVADVPFSRLHAQAGQRALSAVGAAVRTGAKVTAVRTDGAGFRVALETPGARGAGEELTAEAVVLAVPPPAVAALAPAASGVDPVRLAALGSSPIIGVHVHYDRPVLDEPFVAVLDSPVQWVFDRTRAAGARTGQLLSVSLSAADHWIGMPVAQVLAVFLPELARLFPAAGTALVLDAFVTREPHATFRQTPGQGALRPPAATALPGLALAGTWTATGWPATMESAVRSGRAAAAALLSGVRLPVTAPVSRPEPAVVA